MDAVTEFLRDPLVIPIISLLIVAALNFVLAIYRSIQQGQFDWEKLPQLLDTVVVRKVFPLALLGAASFFVNEDAVGGALTVAYLTGATAALAAEVKALIDKVTGSYAASPNGGRTPDGP